MRYHIFLIFLGLQDSEKLYMYVHGDSYHKKNKNILILHFPMINIEEYAKADVYVHIITFLSCLTTTNVLSNS